jgi:photosystem II stability/assembly factor-like uncharacterized protein
LLDLGANTGEIELMKNRALLFVCAIALAAGNAAAQSWQQVTSGTASTLNRVRFATADRGHIVGGEGIVLQTVDAGATWQRLTMDPSIDLYDIAALPNGSLVVVGERHNGGGGVAGVSYDTGATWWTPLISTSYAITAVDFVDAQHGFAVAGPSVFRTDDGGLTWLAQEIATSFFLNDIRFTDALHGLASGGRHDIIGFAMHTEDGGRTWQRDSDTYVEPILGLTSAGTTLWRVGGDFEFGAYLSRSNDGGLSWSHTVIPSVQTSMSGIVFSDGLRGTAVGGRTVLETADGGATWAATDALTAGYLTSIAITARGDRWTVGSGGTILHAASVSAVKEAGAPTVALLDAYPNPAVSATDLQLSLPERSVGALVVYDMAGNAVRTIASGTLGEGSHAIHWDLTDDAGHTVSNGVYLCRLALDGRTMVKRITVAR